MEVVWGIKVGGMDGNQDEIQNLTEVSPDGFHHLGGNPIRVLRQLVEQMALANRAVAS
jgi:hypothetical protein